MSSTAAPSPLSPASVQQMLETASVAHAAGSRPLWRRLLTRGSFAAVWIFIGINMSQGLQENWGKIKSEMGYVEPVVTLAQWQASDPVLPSSWGKQGFDTKAFVRDRVAKGYEAEDILLQQRLLNMVAGPAIFNSQFRPTPEFAAGFAQRQTLIDRLAAANVEQFWQWWPGAARALQHQSVLSLSSDYEHGLGLLVHTFPETIDSPQAWRQWSEDNVLAASPPKPKYDVQPATRAQLQEAVQSAGLTVLSLPVAYDTPQGRGYVYNEVRAASGYLKGLTGWKQALGLNGRIGWSFRPSLRVGAEAHASIGEGMVMITSLPDSIIHEWAHGLSGAAAKQMAGKPTTQLATQMWDSWSLRTKDQRQAWKELHERVVSVPPKVLEHDDQVSRFVRASKRAMPELWEYVGQRPELRAALARGEEEALKNIYNKTSAILQDSKMAVGAPLAAGRYTVWLWSALTMEEKSPTPSWVQRRAMVDQLTENDPRAISLQKDYFKDPEETLATALNSNWEEEVDPTRPLRQEMSDGKEWRAFFDHVGMQWARAPEQLATQAVDISSPDIPAHLRTLLLEQRTQAVPVQLTAPRPR